MRKHQLKPITGVTETLRKNIDRNLYGVETPQQDRADLSNVIGNTLAYAVRGLFIIPNAIGRCVDCIRDTYDIIKNPGEEYSQENALDASSLFN